MLRWWLIAFVIRVATPSPQCPKTILGHVQRHVPGKKESRAAGSAAHGTLHSLQEGCNELKLELRITRHRCTEFLLVLRKIKPPTWWFSVAFSFAIRDLYWVWVEFSVTKHHPGILNLFEKLVLRVVQSPSDYARELILVCSKLALRKKETVHSRSFCINEWTMISCPSGYWSFFLAALSGCTILLLLPPPTHPWIECLSLEILF